MRPTRGPRTTRRSRSSGRSNVPLIRASRSWSRRIPGSTASRYLKGKKVSFAKGTANHYFFVSAAQKAGLDPSTVELVTIPLTEARSAFIGGAVDALVTSVSNARPLVSKNGSKILVTSQGQFVNYPFLVATKAALADPKKSEALGDLLTRLENSNRWEADHLDEVAKIYGKTGGGPVCRRCKAIRHGGRRPLRATGRRGVRHPAGPSGHLLRARGVEEPRGRPQRVRHPVQLPGPAGLMSVTTLATATEYQPTDYEELAADRPRRRRKRLPRELRGVLGPLLLLALWGAVVDGPGTGTSSRRRRR